MASLPHSKEEERLASLATFLQLRNQWKRKCITSYHEARTWLSFLSEWVWISRSSRFHLRRQPIGCARTVFIQGRSRRVGTEYGRNFSARIPRPPNSRFLINLQK